MAAVYDATSPILMALLSRILGRLEDAEEILLDVYLKAWHTAERYDSERGSVIAWLMTMARSAALDRLRSRASRDGRMAALPEEAALPALLDTPEDLSIEGQTRSRIRGALAQLPSEQRQALEIAYFQGLSHSELAGRLGIPLGTAKTRVRRGLTRLRSLLEGVV
jgi:RNA polymerase sigma-70 factor (ECF subfamily)